MLCTTNVVTIKTPVQNCLYQSFSGGYIHATDHRKIVCVISQQSNQHQEVEQKVKQLNM